MSTKGKKIKSEARRNAGKQRALKLKKWQQALKAARDQLKERGCEVIGLPKKGTDFYSAAKVIFEKL